MQTRAVRSGGEDFSVLADGRIPESLTLVRFTRGLMHPYRIRRDTLQLHRLQIGVVREQPTGVVQHLRIIGIPAGQFQGDAHGVRVAPEAHVRALQVKADEPHQRRIPPTREGPLETRKGFGVLPHLRL